MPKCSVASAASNQLPVRFWPAKFCLLSTIKTYEYCPQYTLVLDIDETLVHCSTDERDSDCDFVLDVAGMPVFARTRPNLHSFLEEASKIFEIITFTAGHHKYAREGDSRSAIQYTTLVFPGVSKQIEMHPVQEPG